jgi:hypothetical protein
MYIFCSVIGPLYLLVSLKNISIRLHVVYCQFLLVVRDLLFIAQFCLLSLLEQDRLFFILMHNIFPLLFSNLYHAIPFGRFLCFFLCYDTVVYVICIYILSGMDR